jgi:hypothetical protein
MFYAVFDVLGMLVFASGATWLVKGQSLFLANVPGGIFDAVLMSIVGSALMLWAAAQILRELIRHPAEKT